jgi:hypothetical protein
MRIRLMALAVAVLAAVVGFAATIAIFIWNDAVTNPVGWGIADGPYTAFIACATLGVGTVSASLGVACAPARILENVASRRSFAIGTGLGGLAVAYALVVQLFFFTWPLAALFVVLAVVNLRTAFRVGRTGADLTP